MLFLTSCSVYQSEGRKNFENKVQRSPNITLTSIDLQNCANVNAQELPPESPAEVAVNDQQRLIYEHPQLTILTEISESATQLCQYQVKRDPLNNMELLQLIEGMNHEP